MSMPAAAKASRMAAGSPPGITGPFQPCGSPRKTGLRPRRGRSRRPAGCQRGSGLRCAPCPEPSAPCLMLRGLMTRGLMPAVRGQAALGHADGQPDEPGDDAGDNQDPLLAGGRDHLRIQPDQARDQPGGGGDDDHRGGSVGVPYDHPEDEGHEADHQCEDGQYVHERMGLPVRVQDVMAPAGVDGACHDDHLQAVSPDSLPPRGSQESTGFPAASCVWLPRATDLG